MNKTDSNYTSKSSDPEVVEDVTIPPPADKADLIASLEALLFVSPGPVSAARLASSLQEPLSTVEKGLESLGNRYKDQTFQRGLRLQNYRGRYQLTTAPELSATIDYFLGVDEVNRLSRAALEALAIIFYRQPVTRPHIDSVRGVNSDGVLKNLLLRGLVQEVGRLEAPGRPILYSATPECLQYFGLSSIDELPPLELDDFPSSGNEE